ncbi:ATP-dependent RNA helicase, DEAD/DEAH box family [Mycobacteroides abscessus subsp. abscessus]|nr:DEAD/DEAH box helicase [Mycobacteroides abscessus]SIK29141.1 ATP-dependent RNA helicase, DEAD/DEAH box family [Mycobacteroides abscessus subsp. abscessus]
MTVGYGRELLDLIVAGTPSGETPVRHICDIPARNAEVTSWPQWAHPDAIAAFAAQGVTAPWSHQVAAATLAFAGRHVVVATGTASGKSVAYQLPILTALASEPRARALYLAPTKALGHDQLRAVRELITGVDNFERVQPCTYDGDSSNELRRFARESSRWIFTNPDMIHVSLLHNHTRWSAFLRGLRYLVVDECHYYRGVFGSNVALILQRLLRLCERYGSHPTVVFASATTANPGAAAQALIGQPVEEVVADGSPHGMRTVALWEPPLLPITGENGAPVRRPVSTETSRLLADLVQEGARTLAFVRSRRGAEMTALGAAHRLAEVDPGLVSQVAAYRAGYLPEDRRALEQALSSGTLTGAATTNALELGVDIAGLDAVVVAGFPGTVASFWQQAGRSGRRGQGSLVVLVARDDPLDTYLVHHPEALLDKPIEAVVIDPTNPHVLRPHLLCAATELPLTEDDVRSLDAWQVVSDLVDDGLLRKRPGGYFAAPGLNPYAAVDIRGSIGGQVMILEADTGRVLGTVDTGRAPATVHPGAVYLHSGETYVVDSLDFGDGIALVHNDRPDYSTFARSTIDIAITGEGERIDLGDIQIGLVPVDVTHQVIGYLRKLTTGEILDFVELDMPSSTLSTKAVMYTVTPEALAGIDIDPLSTLHSGETYVVDSLDFGDGIALVHNDRPDYSTFARSTIDIAITGEGERIDLGDIQIGLVPVDVTHRVIGYLRKLTTGEILDFVELDMPSSTLSTKAVMYTVTPEALADIDIDPLSTPGALHAAEHAAIGLLPLVASCDRADIGGVSTALQPETGLPTVFVYDGHPGGAGFAARGYHKLATWLGATADAIDACECDAGCPSCVQSPKCGNGNSPLDKRAAVKVLRLVLSRLPG